MEIQRVLSYMSMVNIISSYVYKYTSLARKQRTFLYNKQVPGRQCSVHAPYPDLPRMLSVGSANRDGFTVHRLTGHAASWTYLHTDTNM